MSERNPYAPPTTDVSPVQSGAIAAPPIEPPFFATSLLKLGVMSLFTLGLYELYWFYKNWQLIKRREKLDVMPFWRAFFAVFFCYSCFSHVRRYEHPAVAAGSLAAGPLAAGWIVLNVSWRLPDPYWLITFFAFLPMLPVQHRINEINNAVAPGHDPNARFTWLNWTGVAIGGVILALNMIGFLYFPEPA